MNKNEKISIIICTYNTEKYIEKCIKSILAQSYKNIEVLIVDDGSKDKTKNIIEKYAKKDNRIKFINNKENKGLSASRNIALENSTGEYIGYIDSDDYVSENYYESLLNSIKKSKCDIAVCDMNLVYEQTGEENRIVCGSDVNKFDFVNNGLAASACNKLFKKNVISKYKFSEGKVNEDLAVIIPAVVENKVCYNSEVYYNYVQRNNSIQNSKITDARFDIFYGVDLTLERIKDDKNNLYKDAIVFQQIILLFLYVLPREKNILRRRNLFKKFNILSKKYNINNNKYLIEFIKSNGKKHQIYYKLLINLNCKGMYLLSSSLITIYNIIRKLAKKNVIKKHIKIETLIKLAKKQKNMTDDSISISVVVPNYNYEKYLYQRIYSILNQKVKLNEIIILDDCSSDNSRESIDEIVNNLKNIINIKKVYNETNSGSAFRQWKKGFELATSDYVWIAEADDYCDYKFLKNIIKPIKENNDIIISYCDTAFIDAKGDIFLKTIKNEIDIKKTGHWDNNYINHGREEFENYTFLNCTIANVSSTLIKKDNYDKYFKLSGDYKQSGDWLFYANIMQKGYVAYNKKALNYYRVHGNNVSSVTKKENHFNEIKKIHNYYEKEYGLNKKQKEQIEKRYNFLKKVWNLK